MKNKNKVVIFFIIGLASYWLGAFVSSWFNLILLAIYGAFGGRLFAFEKLEEKKNV